MTAGVLEQEDKRSAVVAAARTCIHAWREVYNSPYAKIKWDAYKAARNELMKAVAFFEIAIGEYDWKGENTNGVSDG